MATVINYTLEEKETIIQYDHESKLYTIYTSVPSHITKCFKQYSNYKIDIISISPNGEPNCIEIKNVPNAITFRNPKKRVSKGGFTKKNNLDVSE